MIEPRQHRDARGGRSQNDIPGGCCRLERSSVSRIRACAFLFHRRHREPTGLELVTSTRSPMTVHARAEPLNPRWPLRVAPPATSSPALRICLSAVRAMPPSSVRKSWLTMPMKSSLAATTASPRARSISSSLIGMRTLESKQIRQRPHSGFTFVGDLASAVRRSCSSAASSRETCPVNGLNPSSEVSSSASVSSASPRAPSSTWSARSRACSTTASEPSSRAACCVAELGVGLLTLYVEALVRLLAFRG